MQTFKFYTNSVETQEIGLKGKREYYVTGYISTDEIDRANEVVTRGAMQEMVAQIKAGNVKLDIEHSTFVGENDIPVGKIVDAGIDDKGVWVKCVLNKSHDKFTTYWNSIREGFLDAFSIAYKVKSAVNEVINGTTVTLLKSIELLNVAITGNPVNRGAKMTEAFLKSLKYINEHELKGEIMNEEQPAETLEQETVVETVVEPKPEEAVVETVVEKEPETQTQQEVENNNDVPVEKDEQAESIKTDDVRPLDQIKSLEAVNAQLKSDVAELRKQLADLNKQLNKPVLKSMVASQVSEAVEQSRVEKTEIKSVFDAIK